jgi:8-oxo-dGTP diphosphatase
MKTSHDSATPAHGQQVITACAFIHREFDGVHKLFMPKRADIKAFLPGTFELPGGHVDFGENIVTGLKREITEELGMSITVGDPFGSFTYTNKMKGSHSIQVTYFAQFVEPVEQIKLDPKDHSTFDWFTEADVAARRAEIVSEDMVDPSHGADPQYLDILRGFELLKGEKVNLG